nr:LytR C-terminal domain-containing protein [Corynebacterium lactis]
MTDGSRRKIAHTSPLAYIAVVGVCAVLAVASWGFAFAQQPKSYPVACSLPGSGTPVASTELVGVKVSAPYEVPVRVYNANGQTGQATTIAEQLRTLGFTPDSATPFGNDPLVEHQDLSCFGQLRFGAAHNAQAVALHSLFPCFELIHDARQDPSVDIALGKGFDKLSDGAQIADAMAALNRGDQVDSATLDNLVPNACS